MDAFEIQGPTRLSGTVAVSGSKNAALPELAAALLTGEPLTLRDVPEVADTKNMRRLLAELGCASEAVPGGIRLHTTDEREDHARYEIVRTMRASVCVLGPMLARRGRARVAMPGGCAIGPRPIDLHLRGLEALGATCRLESGDVVLEAPEGGLRGATIFLGGPFGSTVLGTANVLCAACLAKGTTTIESAACEPEVVDLARMLSAMGARIQGAGSPRIRVEGVDRLGGTEHRVMPDRIEAGTFLCAAAITGGDVAVENCPTDALLAVVDRLAAAGVVVEPEGEPTRGVCRVRTDGPLRPVEVTTQPFPGYPTDLQAQLMAVLCLARGNSVITEKIFPERFLHAAELMRMGASIIRQGPTAVVSGVEALVGAPVMASDLRASASLVLAGLAAQGTTVVRRVYHLDRGYVDMESKLIGLGATIARVNERET